MRPRARQAGAKERNPLPLVTRQKISWLSWCCTRRFSRRLFRCFGHTSREALIAPEKLREKSCLTKFLLLEADSFCGKFRTPVLVHLAILIQWTAVLRSSRQMEQTSCVDAVRTISHLFSCHLGIGNLMATISSECRDAKDTNQMKGGTRQVSPCDQKEGPNMIWLWRRRPRVLHRIIQKHGEPGGEAPPVAFEQRSPANHIDLQAFARKKLLNGRIPHESVGLSEIRQHADRPAGCPAEEPSDQKKQDACLLRCCDRTGVIPMWLQAVSLSTMGTDHWRHHFRMTSPSDVKFRVPSELENDLHRSSL